MSNKIFSDILNRLQNKEKRWEAMLDMKFIRDECYFPFIIKALKHPHSLTRWVMAEACQELGLIDSISKLFDLLLDKDKQVRITAFKALKSFGLQSVGTAIKFLCHSHIAMRKAAYEIINASDKNALPIIFDSLPDLDPLTQRRAFNFIWSLSPFDAEPYLIKGLAFEDCQEQAILMLGQLKSTQAIIPLINLYIFANRRNLILMAFESIGSDKVYPIIAQNLIHPSRGKASLLLCQKIGKVILPFIYVFLKKSSSKEVSLWKTVLSQLKNDASF